MTQDNSKSARMSVTLFFFLLFLFILDSVSAICPPGLFPNPQCNNQCTYCSLSTTPIYSIWGVSLLETYNCDTSGNCLSCPTPATQYGPQCTNCLQTRSLKDLFAVPPTYTPIMDYCSTEYAGTTCGNSVSQTTLCRCLDPTKHFVLPSAPVPSSNFIYLTYYSSITPPYFGPPPNPIDYCCVSGCPAGTWGCNCQFKCAAGCLTCSNAQVCSGCAQDNFLVNGVCHSCSPYCILPSSSSAGPACQSPTGNCLTQCVPGFYGAQCANQCPICPPNSICSDGKNGTGSCICSITGQILSQAYGICIVPTCGSDRSNLCSNHGLCDQIYTVSGYNEYCLCDPGWNGTDCSIPFTGYTECDCGVYWNSGYQVSSINLLPQMMILNDMPGVNLLGTPAIFHPIGTVQQGEHLAYQDFFADGFLTWLSPLYGDLTGQAAEFPNPVLMSAYFHLGLGTPAGYPAFSPVSVLPVGVTFTLYTIERTTYNNCSSSSLDIDYFYTNNQTMQQVIGAYCTEQQVLESGKDQPCNSQPNANYPNAIVNYWPLRYWRYVAHQVRINPNSNCQMQPVVFDPSSYCAKSRCLSLSGTGPPCILDGSVAGYCSVNQNNPTGFQCSCLQFFDTNNEGPGNLNFQPLFIGEACQFPVTSFCISPDSPHILCSGVANACQSKREWNGTFFLQNYIQFETQLYNEFVPFCNCAGSAFTGQYCQTSLCPQDCNSQGGGGTCISNGNSSFCKCNDGWLGASCQINAAVCVYNHVNCNGQGQCLLDSGNNPFCSCNTGFLGAQCQNFYCSLSQMVPGHGTCLNGIAFGCYPPYLGPSCAVDSCARYGGVVTGNPPSGCNCVAPYANLLGSSTIVNQVAQSTGTLQVVAACWPQCPFLFNLSLTCGVPGAGICLQTELPPDFTRTAVCQCNPGYLFNSTTGLCDAFCANGVVPSGWTPNNLLPCLCSPVSGFDTNNGLNPKCDHPVCDLLGSFNITSNKCDCVPPFNSFTNCLTSECTITQPSATVIPWIQGRTQFRCNCPLPSAPLDPNNNPYDCAGTVCGNNGTPNPNFNGVAKNACFCQGQFRTICNDTALVCPYCQGSFCLNNGYPNPTNINLCTCLFPFTGSNCGNSLCVNGFPSINGFCVCEAAFTGNLCDQPVCGSNGQFFNNTCLCSTGFTGQQCQTKIQLNPITYNPETGIISGLPSPPTTTTLIPVLSTAQAGAVLATAAVALIGGIAVTAYIVINYTSAAATTALVGARMRETRPLIVASNRKR